MKDHRTAWVLGLGESGRAAALLLHERGHDVLAVDEADSERIRQAVAPLERAGVAVAIGVRDLPAGRPDVAVLSPGLRPDHAWLARLRAAGVKLVPEFELGWSMWSGRTVAVTGSNGKSCAVKWLAESLRCAGHEATPCGNYGLTVSELVRRGAGGWAV